MSIPVRQADSIDCALAGKQLDETVTAILWLASVSSEVRYRNSDCSLIFNIGSSADKRLWFVENYPSVLAYIEQQLMGDCLIRIPVFPTIKRAFSSLGMVPKRQKGADWVFSFRNGL